MTNAPVAQWAKWTICETCGGRIDESCPKCHGAQGYFVPVEEPRVLEDIVCGKCGKSPPWSKPRNTAVCPNCGAISQWTVNPELWHRPQPEPEEPEEKVVSAPAMSSVVDVTVRLEDWAEIFGYVVGWSAEKAGYDVHCNQTTPQGGKCLGWACGLKTVKDVLEWVKHHHCA